MHRSLATHLIGAIATGVLAFGVQAATAHSSPCHEDQPCWNWRTMGNHKRGIVTTDGRYRVVGPRMFNRYRDAGHINFTHCPRLPGDWQ